MLKAKKSKLFEKLFSIYNQNLISRRFNSFNVLGLDKLINRNKEVPTIIYGNHSSWWDGLLAFQFTQKAKGDFHVMMEEKQLKDLQLFRKLGAFSVVREKPRSAIESLNYASKLLREKENVVLCIFPQGEIFPNNKRPIEFYRGISRLIAKIDKCQVCCFAIKLEFLGEYKPEIFIQIEQPNLFDSNEKINTKQLTKELASKLDTNLTRLEKSITNEETENFINLLS